MKRQVESRYQLSRWSCSAVWTGGAARALHCGLIHTSDLWPFYLHTERGAQLIAPNARNITRTDLRWSNDHFYWANMHDKIRIWIRNFSTLKSKIPSYPALRTHLQTPFERWSKSQKANTTLTSSSWFKTVGHSGSYFTLSPCLR